MPAALFALTTGLLVFMQVREPAAEPNSFRLIIPPPEHAAYPSYNQIESPPVISPDGRQIAFVPHEIGGPDSVWVRSRDSLTARALPGTDGVPHPVFVSFGRPTVDRLDSSRAES